MYTCCPECRTWFRVARTQLHAARGWVRCGQCLSTFDASPRLWSEPDEGSPRVSWEMDQDLAMDPDLAADQEPAMDQDLTADATGAAGTEPEESGPELPGESVRDESFDPLPDPFLEDPLGDDRIPPSVSLTEIDIDVDLDPVASGPLVGDVDQVSANPAEAGPRPGRVHAGRVSSRRRRSREQAIIERIEGMDVRRGRRWVSSSCVVLLLLLFVTQYAWFMAGSLAAAFPVLGPALDEFCEAAGCETRGRTGDDGIRVVSREVRPHAEFSSALAVRATIENRSPDVRPFPVVVFVLYGKDGRAVASRAFEPAEYLARGAEPRTGLGSGRRADIAFDLVAPSEVAVSFDLRLI